MKRRDFLRAAPATLIASALPVSAMATTDPIPAWFAEWQGSHHDWMNLTEGTPEEQAASDRAEELAKLIANTKATSTAGIIAQFAWFKQDLGDYVTSMVSESYAGVLDNLEAGIGGLV